MGGCSPATASFVKPGYHRRGGSPLNAPLLQVEGLTVEFANGFANAHSSALRAVDDVSFTIGAGRTTALVGESGSGKSVTALSLLGLHDRRTTRVTGEARFAGTNLLGMEERALRAVRGRRIGMIFQDPGAALDPSWRVGDQIAEAVRAHQGSSGGARSSAAAARTKAIALLASVGVPAPEERVDAWPHELSGGLKQRVMIAIALAADPELLIADEPTTALDPTIQAQIMDLLQRLQRERAMALLLVTHDLALASSASDDVVVMYAGRVVERGPVERVLHAPRHPYTAGLIAATRTPSGDGAPSSDAGRRRRLVEIPGVVPDLRLLPSGCRFQDRCRFVQDRCRAEEPLLEVPSSAAGADADAVRCFFPLDAGAAAAARP